MSLDLHDMIAQLACDIYKASGGLAGHDLDNWLQAESIVKTRYSEKSYKVFDLIL